MNDLATTDNPEATKLSVGKPWFPWSPNTPEGRLTITRGSGARVWDHEGREYLDASNLSLTCGYANARVVKAVADQLGVLHGVDLSTANHPRVGELAARVGAALPPSLSHTLFLNSGSEAIEAALFVSMRSRRLSGDVRDRVVTMERGYHGSTLLTRSLSGLPATGHDLDDPMGVVRIPLLAQGAAVRSAEGCTQLLGEFEAVFNDGPPPAAVVIEPLLNVGGGVVFPSGFLSGLRRLCTSFGTHLIIDEVFTGWARTGRMFAIEHEGVVPDVLVTSKGLGGGYVPISSVTASEQIHEAIGQDALFGGLRYGHTTSGHAAACAGALAVLDVIEEEDLVAHAERQGAALLAALDRLAEANDAVVDARGLGLIAVLEFADADAASDVMRRAQHEGVLLRQQGPSVFVVPPVNASPEELDLIIDRVGGAVCASAV